MSSLPPYNPPRTRRLAWLLNSDGVADAVAAAGSDLGDIGAAWVEGPGIGDTVSQLVSCPVWHRIDGAETASDVAAAVRAVDGSVMVVAGERFLQAFLVELLELTPGGARFRFIAGATTTVQLLHDRAVLRHLNQGGALEAKK